LGAPMGAFCKTNERCDLGNLYSREITPELNAGFFDQPDKSRA
jgi:hypothetical protein